MKDLTLNELQEQKIIFYNSHHQDRVNTAAELVKKVSEFYPCFAVFTVGETDDRVYLEYATIYLTHPTLKITIEHGHRKKWEIKCRSIWDFKNVSSYDKDPTTHRLTEPNQIGVLSAKKILQWVNFYEHLFTAIAGKEFTNMDKKQAFRDSVKDLPVKWDERKENGSIRKNGLIYSFNIGDTYVSEKIELDRLVDGNLSNFLRMSDNKI